MDASLSDDEAFLDEIFDQITTSLHRGEPLRLEPLVAARPHLADDIAELARVAADTAVVASAEAPRIAGYELVRELGRGGMGSVFLARQLALGGRLVALKVLPHGGALSPQAKARFQREATALAQIRHPHVVEVFDVIPHGANPAYSMEWVDGWSLQEIVEHLAARGRPVDAEDVAELFDLGERCRSPFHVYARWGVQCAGALAAAHDQGLLHRDVKPSNIMVRRDGTALLTDFGLVRDEGASAVTRTGAFLGTPAYASPEQLRCEGVGARSDVYSLGATLYHACARRAPFEGDDVHLRIEAGLLTPLRKLDARVPRDLATIVHCAMDSDPNRRYASAGDLGADLERFLEGRPILARPAGPWTRTLKSVRRHRSSVVGAVIGGLAVLATTIAVAVYFVRQAAIPGRVAEHVRRAQLVLLDPDFDERVHSARHLGLRPSQWNRQQRAVLLREAAGSVYDEAIGHLDLALALREDRSIRAARETVALSRDLVLGDELRAAALEPLAPRTCEVARRWRDEGQAPAAEEVAIEGASLLDRRCLGLLAVLGGAESLCIEAWRDVETVGRSDPLVDAALGQLYWQLDQPALAWPRLERACAHFDEAGFLAVRLAESALRAGDPGYALKVLDHAETLNGFDRYGSKGRVRADVLAAVGRDEEAWATYDAWASRGSMPPMGHRSLAEAYARRGDFERALQHFWRSYVRWPAVAGTVAGLAATLEGQWRQLDRAGREALLRASLDEPGTFLDQVAVVGAAGDPSPHTGIDGLLRDTGLTSRRLLAWRNATRDEKDRRVAAWLGDGPAPLDEPARLDGWGLGGGEPDGAAWAGGAIDIVSCTDDGAVANGDCGEASVDASGRFVAFASLADNLCGGDRNEAWDVFVRDREAQRTICISRARDGRGTADGESRRPCISSDGGVVVFASRASDLVADDANGGWDWFCWDRATGAVRCLTVDHAGVPVGIASDALGPNVSLDGAASRVLHWTRCGMPRTEDRLGTLELRDVATGRVIWRLARSFVRESDQLALTPDGRRAVFTTTDEDLWPGDANGALPDLFAIDVVSGEAEILDAVGGRQADFGCGDFCLSADGETLAFRSSATNLFTVVTPSTASLFVRDLESGSMRVVRAPRADELALVGGSGIACAAGRTAFCRGDERASLVPQVWVCDGRRGMALVSANHDGRPADAACVAPALSDDGRVIAFTSAASNLGLPTRGIDQVFVRDLPAPTGPR